MKFLILIITSILLLISCDETTDNWVDLSYTVPDELTERYDSCTFYDDTLDTLYIIGGINTNQRFNDIWQFSVSNKKFNKIVPDDNTFKKAGRAGYCVFDKESNYLYMYGNNEGGNASPSPLLRWGIGGKQLIELAPASSLPSLRGHSLNLITDKSIFGEKSLIIFGGQDTGGTKNNKVSIFKLDSKELIELETLGPKPPARYTHSAFLYNNKLIVIGGYSTAPLNDVWSLDLKTKTWFQLGNKTICKDTFDSSAVYNQKDKKIILYGGKDSSKNPTSTFCEYDIATDTWKEIDNSKPGQIFKASTSFGEDNFYLFGGNKLKDGKLKEINSFWRYDF